MSYTTFRIPVVGEGVHGDPLRAKYRDELNGAPFRRHYKVLWYGAQLPKHPLKKRIIARVMRRGLPANEMWCEVTVKDCPPEVHRQLLSHDDVTFTETPDEWRF